MVSAAVGYTWVLNGIVSKANTPQRRHFADAYIHSKTSSPSCLFAGCFQHLMKAFYSIKMGCRCKTWSTQDVNSVNSETGSESQSPTNQRVQWNTNATAGSRLSDVINASTAVLDGGPRWVLSTALGFLTGGLWWTVILICLFVLGNYLGYTSSESVPWASAAERSGLIVYTI